MLSMILGGDLKVETLDLSLKCEVQVLFHLDVHEVGTSNYLRELTDASRQRSTSSVTFIFIYESCSPNMGLKLLG